MKFISVTISIGLIALLDLRSLKTAIKDLIFLKSKKDKKAIKPIEIVTLINFI